jgi:ATPase family associated with various cellular activities (AAA)
LTMIVVAVEAVCPVSALVTPSVIAPARTRSHMPTRSASSALYITERASLVHLSSAAHSTDALLPYPHWYCAAGTAPQVIELPIKHPELFEALGVAQPKGVLLYGPPGTGKTLLARAVAHHTDCTFIRVSGSELVQKYIGEVREGAGAVVAAAARACLCWVAHC